jgi:hypothetical protein
MNVIRSSRLRWADSISLKNLMGNAYLQMENPKGRLLRRTRGCDDNTKMTVNEVGCDYVGQNSCGPD